MCLRLTLAKVLRDFWAIRRAVMTSHSRCTKDSTSCDTKANIGCWRTCCQFRSCSFANIVAVAVFSVSYFSMLLKNFVAAYQSLREACTISGRCTSTRTWSVFHCSPYLSSPYLSQLTRCGRIQNEPSSVARWPLSQPIEVNPGFPENTMISSSV